MNIDKYTKIILTIIALNTTLMVGDSLLGKLIPDVWAQGTMNVYVEGGELDTVGRIRSSVNVNGSVNVTGSVNTY